MLQGVLQSSLLLCCILKYRESTIKSQFIVLIVLDLICSHKFLEALACNFEFPASLFGKKPLSINRTCRILSLFGNFCRATVRSGFFLIDCHYLYDSYCQFTLKNKICSASLSFNSNQCLNWTNGKHCSYICYCTYYMVTVPGCTSSFTGLQLL